MKKVLFIGGLLALATSCTQDELDSFSQDNVQQKGISFVGSLEGDVQSRADLNWNGSRYEFFWYAETDEINIYSSNTILNPYAVDPADVTTNHADLLEKNSKAEYKATKSMANGDFTSVNEANLLTFANVVEDEDDANVIEDKTARFLGTYPTTVTLKENEVAETAGQVVLTGFPVLNLQNVTTLDNFNEVSKNIAMYNYTTAYATENYDAVGEKVKLRMVRPFTAAQVSTVGIDETYSDLFGNLKLVKITAKGYDADGDSDYSDEGDIKGSLIANTTANSELTLKLNASKVNEGFRCNVLLLNTRYGLLIKS